MLNERLRNATVEGVSILLGTVDAEGMPACCRGVALRLDDALEVVTVYVPVDTGQETIANIATTRRIAIVASNPATHASIQVKGVTRAVRLARSDEAAEVREQVSAFAKMLEMLGVPQRVTMSLTHWPAFAVEVGVEEVYDQTPGPQAGTALR